jgi:hypothetical protein
MIQLFMKKKSLLATNLYLKDPSSALLGMRCIVSMSLFH